jgi:hypothetical protein
MATPRILVQFQNILHHLGSKRIEMDVANQLCKVMVFITNDGFVSILKKITTPGMTSIVSDRIAC